MTFSIYRKNELLTNNKNNNKKNNKNLPNPFYVFLLYLYLLLLQVAQFLKIWKPKHNLQPNTKRLLEDFLGTRGKK